MNSRCILYVTEYTDCTEENLCSGCKYCSCDGHNAWVCKDINECGTEAENLRRSQDIEEDEKVDARRFEKAYRLLEDELEESRRSTYLAPAEEVDGHIRQENTHNLEGSYSRNKRDSKSKMASVKKSNDTTKLNGAALDVASKSITNNLKMEAKIIMNVSRKSDVKSEKYGSSKKLNLKNNTEKATTDAQFSNNDAANETSFLRNQRDLNKPESENIHDINKSNINDLVNLNSINTKDLTNIYSKISLTNNNEDKTLMNQGRSVSDSSLNKTNGATKTAGEINENFRKMTDEKSVINNDVGVDLAKLEDLTNLLKMFNEPLPAANSNRSKSNEIYDRSNIIDGISSIDKFHDLLSEATKLDPLKYHAQLLENLIESVIPSNADRKESSKQVLLGIKDKKSQIVKYLPYLSKSERNALENEETLSPKDRLLITLLARDSNTITDPETMKSGSQDLRTILKSDTGNELVDLLQKLTNALEQKSELKSVLNNNVEKQEKNTLDEILKELGVENKQSIYGTVKKILCELIDGCDPNNLRFSKTRDNILDVDNIIELKRHLLKLLADLERFGKSSTKYDSYDRAKVDDVLSDSLQSVDDDEVKTGTDQDKKSVYPENETDKMIKMLRHAHSSHHTNDKARKTNKDQNIATKILAKMLRSLNLLKTEAFLDSRRTGNTEYLPEDTPYDASKSVMLWERIIHNLEENSETKQQAKTRKMNTLPKIYHQNDITSIISSLENDDLILRKSGNTDIANDPTFKLSILKAQELEMSKYIKTLEKIRDVMDNVELSPKFLKKIENVLVDIQYDLDLNKHVIDTVSSTQLSKNEQDVSSLNVFNQFIMNDRAVSDSMNQVTTTQKSLLASETNREDIHSLKTILQKYNIRRRGGFEAQKNRNTLVFKKEDIYNQIAKNGLNKLTHNKKLNPDIYSIKYNNYIQDGGYVPRFLNKITTESNLYLQPDNIEGVIASMCSKVPCQSRRRFINQFEYGNSIYAPQFRSHVGDYTLSGNPGMESLIESICSKTPCLPQASSMDAQNTLPLIVKENTGLQYKVAETPRLLFAVDDDDGVTRIQKTIADKVSRSQLQNLLRGIYFPKIQ